MCFFCLHDFRSGSVITAVIRLKRDRKSLPTTKPHAAGLFRVRAPEFPSDSWLEAFRNRRSVWPVSSRSQIRAFPTDTVAYSCLADSRWWVDIQTCGDRIRCILDSNANPNAARSTIIKIGCVTRQMGLLAHSVSYLCHVDGRIGYNVSIPMMRPNLAV